MQPRERVRLAGVNKSVGRQTERTRSDAAEITKQIRVVPRPRQVPYGAEENLC
jgi:hypothetical protein